MGEAGIADGGRGGDAAGTREDVDIGSGIDHAHFPTAADIADVDPGAAVGGHAQMIGVGAGEGELHVVGEAIGPLQPLIGVRRRGHGVGAEEDVLLVGLPAEFDVDVAGGGEGEPALCHGGGEIGVNAVVGRPDAHRRGEAGRRDAGDDVRAQIAVEVTDGHIVDKGVEDGVAEDRAQVDEGFGGDVVDALDLHTATADQRRLPVRPEVSKHHVLAATAREARRGIGIEEAEQVLAQHRRGGLLGSRLQGGDGEVEQSVGVEIEPQGGARAPGGVFDLAVAQGVLCEGPAVVNVQVVAPGVADDRIAADRAGAGAADLDQVLVAIVVEVRPGRAMGVVCVVIDGIDHGAVDDVREAAVAVVAIQGAWGELVLAHPQVGIAVGVVVSPGSTPGLTGAVDHRHASGGGFHKLVGADGGLGRDRQKEQEGGSGNEPMTAGELEQRSARGIHGCPAAPSPA